MSTKEELYFNWKHVAAVSIYKGKRFEGVPIDEKWIEFEGFYKDNIQRYLRAKRKWVNYQRITKPNDKSVYKVRLINFIRKDKSLGYTKKNTVFTSVSDRMKYHKTSYKIVFDGKQMLGTRDVKNILLKKGINRSMTNLSAKLSKGEDIFEVNRLAKWKWKGKYQSLKSICKLENINEPLLSNKVFQDKMSINKAVEYCKKYEPPTYPFEGEQLYTNQICKILSDRHGIKESTLRSRFYKWGYDVSKLIINKSKHKNAPYKKIVIAEKDNKRFEFNSISEAGKELNISQGNISSYASGKRVGKLKGYTFSFRNHR